MVDLALRSRLIAVLAAALLVSGDAVASAPPLRVCADPNNMPFSRADGAGFENRLAEIVGAGLGRPVEFEWRAQRRGFLRQGLNAGVCDLVAGVPTRADAVLATRPYYRSTYVFVTRRGEPAISSLDDPALKRLRIGVQLIGDDGRNTPPAHELARRGIVDNVRGYPIYGDYAKAAPPSAILDALARGEIDVAAVWGPLAGYFAATTTPPLVVTRMDATGALLPLAFDISVGVRKNDMPLAEVVQKALDDERPAINRLLDGFRVPQVTRADGPAQPAQRQ